MNEEELKKKIRRLSKENHTKYYDDDYGEDLEIDNDKEIERLKRILEGFQKGKLEEKERIEEMNNYCNRELGKVLEYFHKKKDIPLDIFLIVSRVQGVLIKGQLQKEIGDDSQTRQSKETSVEKGGGKAERYLFNSDNVSSADTLKLNHKCPICDKDIYLRDDTVNEKGVIYHLGCYLFENHFTINDSLKDIWDNPEDNRWDREEEKQDE